MADYVRRAKNCQTVSEIVDLFANRFSTFTYEGDDEKNRGANVLSFLTDTAKIFSAAFKEFDSILNTDLSRTFLIAVKAAKGTLAQDVEEAWEESVISTFNDKEWRGYHNYRSVEVNKFEENKGIISGHEAESQKNSFLSKIKTKLTAKSAQKAVKENLSLRAIAEGRLEEKAWNSEAFYDFYKKVEKIFSMANRSYRAKFNQKIMDREDVSGEMAVLANDLVSLAKAFGLEQYFQGAVAQELKL